MTECIYRANNKFVDGSCSLENIQECTGKLENDKWTTFVGFSQHVDNLCYYYDSIKYEKASEYLLTKLAGFSGEILQDLSNSNQLVQSIVGQHERLSSEMANSLEQTIKEFGKISNLIEDYKLLEEKVIKLDELAEKVGQNTVMIDSLFDSLNAMGFAQDYFTTHARIRFTSFFYFVIVALTYCATCFDATKRMRLFLLTTVVLYYLMEIVAIGKLGYLWNSFNSFLFDIVFNCFRIILVALIALVLYFSAHSYNSPQDKLNEQVDRVNSKIKRMAEQTPAWMRKYYGKIREENDEIRRMLGRKLE